MLITICTQRRKFLQLSCTHQKYKENPKVSILLTRMFYRMGRKKKKDSAHKLTHSLIHTYMLPPFIPLNHSQGLNNTKIVNVHFL